MLIKKLWGVAVRRSSDRLVGVLGQAYGGADAVATPTGRLLCEARIVTSR
ncbi:MULTISPECIES: hypothetical protein [Streptosporangium]|uniref:Uncharacterized protein n=1 Tax=Streptosporangium jomthongense TaxID=1193683 RepID=A0ABV8F287_9ACTN